MTRHLDAALASALEAAAAALHLPLTATQADTLLAFLALLQQWNSAYNLTAIRDPAAMVVQHLVDCMAVIPSLQRQTDRRPARVLDVGSGAGLPGVVLATLCPVLDVTCVDTVGKKAAFVRQVASELCLRNLHSLHGRVETLTEGPFDIVASRAFASLGDFIHLSRNALAPSGVWMAMKGRRPVDELAAIDKEVDVFHVEPLTVPGLDADRCIVWMRPLGQPA